MDETRRSYAKKLFDEGRRPSIATVVRLLQEEIGNLPEPKGRQEICLNAKLKRAVKEIGKNMPALYDIENAQFSPEFIAKDVNVTGDVNSLIDTLTIILSEVREKGSNDKYGLLKMNFECAIDMLKDLRDCSIAGIEEAKAQNSRSR